MAKFKLYVLSGEDGSKVPAKIQRAMKADLKHTTEEPVWQTDWTSDYISAGDFKLYSLKTLDGELVALGAYELCPDIVIVHIVYMESQAESNPTMTSAPRYRGIGRALIAFGIKLSVDAGFNGDVTLDAKTLELARHYEEAYHAVRLPGRAAGTAPRYLICDEAARDIFTQYLKEG